MTGEITLRGRVLAGGGIKDKVLAAHRAGIKTVLVPKQNENDLANIPDTVWDSICCIPVESIDEVLKESFIDVVVPQDTSIERIVQAERERSAAKEQSELVNYTASFRSRWCTRKRVDVHPLWVPSTLLPLSIGRPNTVTQDFICDILPRPV